MAHFSTQIDKHKLDRWNLVQKSRSLLEASEKENRSMTTEERAEFDTMNKAVEGHEGRIKDLEKLNANEEQVEGDEPNAVAAERSRGRAGSEMRDNPLASKEYRDAFKHWFSTGEKRTAIDMTVGTQSQGGYLVAPVEISQDIVKQIDNLVFIRQLARFYKVTTTQALGVRQMTARVDDADWTTEIASVAQDTSLAFARRDLTPNLLTKLVKASTHLMLSGVDVMSIVNEELAYKNGISQEKGFLNGSGSGQPLGVFTASASGVPTSQDVTSTASANFLADDLIAMRYFLKQPYLVNTKSARWVMGRAIAQEVRTFKDSYGQYLWRPGLAGNAPDTILDIPLAISEYAPVVKTAGSYIAVLGNFSYYAIAELQTWAIQRLVERYADTNEIGFISRAYVDGAPVLGEAFCRLKTSV